MFTHAYSLYIGLLYIIETPHTDHFISDLCPQKQIRQFLGYGSFATLITLTFDLCPQKQIRQFLGYGSFATLTFDLCPQKQIRQFLGYGSFATDIKFWQSQTYNGGTGEGDLTSQSSGDVNVSTDLQRRDGRGRSDVTV